MSNSANGFLLINKSVGLTSFRLLGPIKKLFKPSKVGHAGTLDQEARGLMVVAIGKASRLLQFAEGASKVYEFTLHVGRETASAEYFHEEVIQEDLDQSFTLEKILEILPKYIGKIQQTPPQYSAVKIDGKRASDRVRAGEEVKLKSREVEIHSLEVIPFAQADISAEVPTQNDHGLNAGALKSIRFRCHCSKGTYIRSLCVDIAKELNLWGSASDIYRTQIGEWKIEDAHPLEGFQFDEETFEAVQKLAHEKLMAASDVFVDWLKIEVPSKTAHFLCQGMKQDLARINQKLFDEIEADKINVEPGVFCLKKSGELVCFAKYQEGDLAPKVVFL